MPSLIQRAFRKLITPLLWDYTSAELQCANIGFSQFGEDVMCHYLFPGGFKGFYVEVGAFHPMSLSNTYALHRKGWRGLAIDANPDLAKDFKRFRPGDKFVHSAVGRETGNIEMALFDDGAFNCTVDQMDKVPEQVRRTIRRLKVPINTLASLLAKENVRTVDFLSIDCEGNDLNVLQSNDWSRWKPRVVCVEDHALNWQQSEIVIFMESIGYALKFRAVFSSVFVPKKMADVIHADSLV